PVDGERARGRVLDAAGLGIGKVVAIERLEAVARSKVRRRVRGVLLETRRVVLSDEPPGGVVVIVDATSPGVGRADHVASVVVGVAPGFDRRWVGSRVRTETGRGVG